MKLMSGVLLGGALILSGCGSGSVPRSSLEKDISKQLAATVHAPPPKIACPKDLPGKVGATEDCVLTDPTAAGKKYSVAVRVDSVNGSNVHFNVQVAKTPLP